MKDKATTINIGSIENARELVFSQGNPDHVYILQAPGTAEDYLTTMDRYPKQSIKRTVECYIDDTEGLWFACYCADCFDPPFVVIRARSWEAAYEVFCNEYEHRFKVDEDSADDYPEEDRNYNDNGTLIDTDNLMINEMQLVQVLL